MAKPELIFIPMPLAGHLASIVNLAKLLVGRDDELSIKILLCKDKTQSSSIHLLSAEASKGIEFVELLEPPQREADSSEKPDNIVVFFAELINVYKPQVSSFIAQLKEPGSSNLVGIVVDFFTFEIIDVANEFEVPTYVFYTSGAATLGLLVDIKNLTDETKIDIIKYKDSDTEFSISTYKNPVPAKQFPASYFDRKSLGIFLRFCTRLSQINGIIINTFLDLESHALKALASNPKMPPVYTMGPMINFAGFNINRQEVENVLRWLDDQPTSSVIFLCFGSMGFFSGQQVREIAKAIEHSECRFLWSLRRPPSEEHQGYPSEYENFEEVLPAGFLDRTSRFGKVIGWAPQIEVLAHPGVGGFVTHCGWNSVLESVWFGVPMAVWPMYAEQQANAFQIVKDLGIAVEIKMDYVTEPMSTREDIVKADEIEEGIKKLMQPRGEIKEKVKELMQKSRSSIVKGGSSYEVLGRFLENLYGVH